MINNSRIVPYALEIADQEYRNKFLNHLNATVDLHEKQREIVRSVFQGFNVVVSCGRKFGKSFTVQYLAIRKAVLFKKAYIYIILPFAKQVREIYWEQTIIPQLCPPGYIKKIDNQAMRITLNSGSFIKFDGSDNTELHRGPAVHLLLPDEIKDIDPAFWPAMLPNLTATKGTFAAFGTPPGEMESEKAKKWFELCDRPLTDPKTKFFIGASEENPYADKAFLRAEKERLIATSQEDVWLREYCGVYKRSRAESIFPMFSRKEHVFRTQDLLEEVNDLTLQGEELEYWLIQDPGSSSVFAQLFLVWHKATSRIWVLDESYVTDTAKATVLEMYKLEVEKATAILGDMTKWTNLYDEQASWFYNERVAMNLADGLIATEKNKWRTVDQKDLKSGLATFKDILAYKLIKIADRCENFITEIQGYRRQHVKRKSKDHLIDCGRYFILKSGFRIPENIIQDITRLAKAPQAVVSRQNKDSKVIEISDLDMMIENDISEMMLSEAIQWDGW